MSIFARLPKIELHAHLSGSITRECLYEIWLRKQREQPDFDLETALPSPLIAIPSGKKDYDLVTFFPLFSSYIYKLCNDIPSIKFSTLSVLQDFEADGVVYLELRTTPREFKETGLTKEMYVETVLEAIGEFNDRKDGKMKTYLILSIDRRDTFEMARECVELAIKFRERGVVGVDLCGDPTKGNIPTFASHFHLAHANNLKVTLHFGETPVTSTDEDLFDLLKFNPDRLGHVIHLSERVREEVAQRGIPLELCVSCNVHARMLVGMGKSEETDERIGTFGDHHFGRWWKEGRCVVVLCTDDVGIFLSPLSNEYALVAQHFHLTGPETYTLAYAAIDAIFAGEEEKGRLRRVFEEWKVVEEEEGGRVLFGRE